MILTAWGAQGTYSSQWQPTSSRMRILRKPGISYQLKMPTVQLLLYYIGQSHRPASFKEVEELTPPLDGRIVSHTRREGTKDGHLGESYHMPA